MQNSFHMGGAPRPGDPANQAMFIPGMPNNPPPFVPQFNCSPPLQPYAPQIMAFTVAALQTRAQENPLRAYYFNVCSANSWNNQDLPLLLSSVADYAELLLATQNTQPQQAIPMAAQEVVAVMVAVVASQTPGCQQFLTLDAHRAAINQALHRFNEIRAGVQQMRQGGFNNGFNGGGYNTTTYANVPNRRGGTTFGHNMNMNMNNGMDFKGPWGGGGNNNGGWNNGNNGGGGPFGVVNNGGPVNPAFGNNNSPGNGNANGSIWSTNPPQQNNSGNNNGYPSVAFGNRGNGVVESVNFDANKPVEMKLESARKHQFPPPPNFSKSRNVTQFVDEPDMVSEPSGEIFSFENTLFYVPEGVSSNWPKTANLQRPYDHILMEDGTQVKPAAFSDWIVETTLENPYHPVFNPNTHVLMHVKKSDGTVIEHVTAWKEDMDYLANELNPQLKRQAREINDLTNPEQKIPTWGLAKMMKPHPKLASQSVSAEAVIESEVAEGEDGSEKEVLEVGKLDHVLMAYGLAEADTKANMAANLAKVDKTMAREYLFDDVDPNVGKNGDRERVEELSKITDYTTLIKKLREFEPRMHPDIFAEVDSRLTQAIVTTLSKALSLDGWSIDNIYDYDDLMNALLQTFGEKVCDLFDASAKLNIPTALRVLDREQTSKYALENFGVKEEDSNTHVVFAKRINVLALPWKMEELSLNFGESGGGIIGEDVLPDLYETAKNVFERHAHDEVPVASYLLRTSDGKTLQFIRGAFNAQTYLIFVID